mmetsp:Transcript_8353/g.26673  ORF Transcript_8353/g.26673 Transcript_8353/m.26673 type:complete len:220 (+) Transcript_8353:777-1436(+)
MTRKCARSGSASSSKHLKRPTRRSARRSFAKTRRVWVASAKRCATLAPIDRDVSPPRPPIDERPPCIIGLFGLPDIHRPPDDTSTVGLSPDASASSTGTIFCGCDTNDMRILGVSACANKSLILGVTVGFERARRRRSRAVGGVAEFGSKAHGFALELLLPGTGGACVGRGPKTGLARAKMAESPSPSDEPELDSSSCAQTTSLASSSSTFDMFTHNKS